MYVTDGMMKKMYDWMEMGKVDVLDEDGSRRHILPFAATYTRLTVPGI
jgi:hypothetical protein